VCKTAFRSQALKPSRYTKTENALTPARRPGPHTASLAVEFGNIEATMPGVVKNADADDV
jgi:hypothetical protein